MAHYYGNTDDDEGWRPKEKHLKAAKKDFLKFRPLFKKSSGGALLRWQVMVKGRTIIIRWGQEGGATQETREKVKKGKNLGKRNATDAREQAIAQARSMWKKRLQHGYVKDPRDALAGKVDSSVAGGIFPMLAQSYDKHAEKIVFPVFVQPKYDGHRCTAVKQNGVVTLWSRKRKQIFSAPHVVKALEALPVDNVVFDGELYNHNYRERFEELSSLIRQQEPAEKHEEIQYHVYDLFRAGIPFRKRYAELRHLFNAARGKAIWIAPTRGVKDEGELQTVFRMFRNAGYEGAMARNAEGMYLPGKRSYDLQKVKEFNDAEFKCLGVREGKGKMQGLAIFRLKTKSGVEFDAKMKGPLKDLRKFWENPKLVVGKRVTVQFQGYYSSGAPRFPVALRIRKDV